MKKQFAIAMRALAAALGLLLLAACANPFIAPMDRQIPAGDEKGLVRIGTGAETARTALPDAVFDHYEYLFSYSWGNAENIQPLQPGGNEFALDAGNWEVAINAYAGTGNDTLAAAGSKFFTITPGEETEITVLLRPVASEGTGTLNVSLSYPNGATVKSFSLTLLAGAEDIDLADGAALSSAVSETLTNTITPGSGYYMARAVLQKDGVVSGKKEVAHIYKNMTTNLAFVFTDNNFKAIEVSSSADSGPGSLRETLANAEPGSTIALNLSPGEDIALYGDLAIGTSVHIEGKGAAINLGGHRIVVEDTAEVRISRVLFKGGGTSGNGGAIANAGSLTLESCIFSDNRIIGSAAASRGGALYSTGALTVLGSTFYGNDAGLGQGGAIYRQSGTAVLQGNLFWGNTAASYKAAGGTLTSLGFNVSDMPKGATSTASGFSHADDAQAFALPFSSVSFKPFAGGDALSVIAQRPADYPEKDFYGTSIPGTDAAAGAAQDTISGTGYILDYAAQGPGTVELSSGNVDADGFVTGEVVLTASEASAPTVQGTFKHWTLDGIPVGEQTPANKYTFTPGASVVVRAVFSGTYTVTSGANDGPGTFREALLNKAADGDTIVLPAAGTITLTAPLPEITRSLVIQGKGATLTQNGFTADNASQLLRVNASTAKVHISRLLFKGGLAAQYGAAIYNNGGTLVLESCVFSDNRTTTSYGGAIYSAGSTASLTVSGCTFYGNAVTAASGTYARGGAIYKAAGTLAMTGNLFWGNTAYTYNVVYGGSGSSGGYNISDKDDGTGATYSGWAFEETDAMASALPLSAVSFRPFAGGDAVAVIDSTPPSYPAEDFYGEAIQTPDAAAGAVQDTTAGTGWILDYAAQGPGTVDMSSGTVDADGFTSDASVTLAASGTTGVFKYWTVNGVEQPAQTPPETLTVNMDGHKTVRALFVIIRQVTSGANDGAGSLRQALADAVAGEYIVFQKGLTVTLTAPLDPINKELVIEGNSATLTQSGFTPSGTSQLLRFNSSANVRISGLHFTGGRSNSYGAAIYNNQGKLALESCIFSDNLNATNSSYGGGAIFATGSTASLSVSGCTFYGNTVTGTTSSASGGAIYTEQSASLTLTGNIFWENTAPRYAVAYISSGTGSASKGYNISDKAGGAGETLSGWAFAGTDAQTSVLPFHIANFKPLSTGAAYRVIDTRPAGYPKLDFYGDPVPVSDAMAGAVQTAVVATAGHYVLDYGAEGLGAVTVTNGTPDNDGLYTGSVTLEAAAADNSIFERWTLDGIALPAQTPPNRLTISLEGHATLRAVFSAVWKVAGNANDGPGSFREALTRAADGDIIILPAGQTITLTAVLPDITKSLTIEGLGATLTQSGFSASGVSQLLRINSATAKVRINRLHFTGGSSTSNGGAIYNNGGMLALESCIFSDNSNNTGSSNSNYGGGAIYTAGANGSLTVSGCTFAWNTVTGTGLYAKGSAIYQSNGTVTLTGNLFWGNTTSRGFVVDGSNVSSGGCNISDKAGGTEVAQSGWDFVQGDAQAFILPFYPSGLSPLYLRPLSTGAAYRTIGTRPEGYPVLDFNGAPIPVSNAMAGALQDAIVSAGYMLDHGAVGPGQVTVSESPDSFGLYAGSTTFTAQADFNKDFLHWTVDGAALPVQPEPQKLVLPMDGHKTVRGVFANWAITNADDDGTGALSGSLSEALAGAANGDYILFKTSVTLTAPLSQITKTLVIEGNGYTLTQNGFTPGNRSSLLYTSSAANIRISRLLFKGGRATQYGAAINNGGILTLESCIFSDNQTSSTYGGAIYTTGTNVTVSGCTFYGNAVTATTGTYARGGAIYKASGTLTLTGNIFWGNTANTFDVVYSGTSGGYNISDKADGSGATTTLRLSGWTFAATDAQALFIPLRPEDFKPFSTGPAYRKITARPAGYPTVDFYGVPIPAYNATAGAIQETIAAGHGLTYTNEGPGTVTLTSGSAGSYGFYTGAVTLSAEPDAANNFFSHWTVNGIKLPEQPTPNVLILPMDGPKTVSGSFITHWTVGSSDSAGTGSFREALTGAAAGDHILLQGQTITLSAVLPSITKSLVIEGNGSTLTQNGISVSSTSFLLRIASDTAEVRISRLRFTGGQSTTGGSAINNTGTLTLESCIFDNNTVTTLSQSGGAIISSGGLTVLGCTFTGNEAKANNSYGAAIRISDGTLRLTGNLFSGNISTDYVVVYAQNKDKSSGGYNVSNRPDGDGSALSGWIFHETDRWLPDVEFDADFKPSSETGLPAIPALPAGFPAKYFDGTNRGSASTPGAMPKQ